MVHDLLDGRPEGEQPPEPNGETGNVPEAITESPAGRKIVKIAPFGSFWHPEGAAEKRETERPPYKTVHVARHKPRKPFYW